MGLNLELVKVEIKVILLYGGTPYPVPDMLGRKGGVSH